MKLRDIVFVLEDRKITKTQIVGVQEVINMDYDKNEKVVKSFLVLKEASGYNQSPDKEWVSEFDHEGKTRNLYTSMEEAQKVIADRIQQEIIDQQSKITLVDLSPRTKVEKTEEKKEEK